MLLIQFSVHQIPVTQLDILSYYFTSSNIEEVQPSKPLYERGPIYEKDKKDEETRDLARHVFDQRIEKYE